MLFPNHATAKKCAVICLFLFWILTFTFPVAGDDRISYTSQPDEIAIFLNDIAFSHDTIALPGGIDVQIILPIQVFPDTLILKENGTRVPTYRMRHEDGQLVIRWQSFSESDLREVTLQYLLSGIGWTSGYDMWLGEPDDETLGFDFFAEITNQALSLDEVAVKLIAGRVDTSQQLDTVSTITANQYAVGYEQTATAYAPTGAATIQHVYSIANISAQPGDTIYVRMQENVLAARRVLLWNAQFDDQVAVIYKVRNDSDLPFAEGIVRTYQNDLFLGSDFIELTPIGSEGSVTVGNLQNVRVNRTETETGISNAAYERDVQHDIELSLSNFGDEAITIEMIDSYHADALDFVFSDEPVRQGNNLFRWLVTIEAGETRTITYHYKD